MELKRLMYIFLGSIIVLGSMLLTPYLYLEYLLHHYPSVVKDSDSAGIFLKNLFSLDGLIIPNVVFIAGSFILIFCGVALIAFHLNSDEKK